MQGGRNSTCCNLHGCKDCLNTQNGTHMCSCTGIAQAGPMTMPARVFTRVQFLLAGHVHQAFPTHTHLEQDLFTGSTPTL